MLSTASCVFVLATLFGQIPPSIPVSRPSVTDPTASSPDFQVEDSVFRLSSGDRLRLRWWGTGSGSEDLVVDTRQNIVFPDFGVVQTAGLTLSEVRQKLEDLLRTRIKPSMIDLRLVTVVSARVNVLGLVPKPGIYTILPGTRLSECLAKAGLEVSKIIQGQASRRDPDESRPSMRRILLIRGGGRDTVMVDLLLAIRGGRMDQDPPIYSGDKICLIPEAKSVIVSGSSVRGGEVERVPGETVATLLSAAGIFKANGELTGQKSTGAAFAVNSTDLVDSNWILVRTGIRSRSRVDGVVWVQGMVASPGGYPIGEGATIQDAVSLAGGVLPSAGVTRIFRIHKNWNDWIPDPDVTTRTDFTQYPQLKYAQLGFSRVRRGVYSKLDGPIFPGDSILVITPEPVVWIGGQVRDPGFVPWKSGASLDDYIDAAGGYSVRPWVSRIEVRDGFSGQVYKASDPIPQGSIVLVPEERYVPPELWIGVAAQVVATIATIITLYVTVNQR